MKEGKVTPELRAWFLTKYPLNSKERRRWGGYAAALRNARQYGQSLSPATAAEMRRFVLYLKSQMKKEQQS